MGTLTISDPDLDTQIEQAKKRALRLLKMSQGLRQPATAQHAAKSSSN